MKNEETKKTQHVTEDELLKVAGGIFEQQPAFDWCQTLHSGGKNPECPDGCYYDYESKECKKIE